MKYCKRKAIVDAYRWGSTKLRYYPPWISAAIISGYIVDNTKTATVQGVHCGIGNWIVKTGKTFQVYGDEYFQKVYYFIKQ